jgi:hypothetical protein
MDACQAASPLTKRSLGRLAGEGAVAAVCFFGGGPVLFVLSSVGIVALRVLSSMVTPVAEALWEGARPGVVELGEDLSEKVLDAFRDRVGIERKSRTSSQPVELTSSQPTESESGRRGLPPPTDS